ncbi:serine hydrolase domain-containing protein [Streptomyces hygroscopicus]|uniref:serine hydrolase domain-containing protein n=2 Tax=Streptomyces hygroscopicus TaxID=1912 RepID=UPI00131D4C77|nr:serine hydrolase domain-containing protein [Streptomyces hygroscopicus]
MALLTVCALVPTAGGAVAAPPAVAPDGSALQAALDRVTATGAIGAVAEVRQGDAVWRGSSGKSRLNGRQPAPANGRFRAGSVTKTFTATVVLQLVGEGRLGRVSKVAPSARRAGPAASGACDRKAEGRPRSGPTRTIPTTQRARVPGVAGQAGLSKHALGLSDTAERWLPGLVPALGGDRITVRDLLQHASGLPEYTDGLLDGDAPRDRFRTWTPAELVRRAVKDGNRDRPLLFPPGTDHHYSNTDYIVLGMIIEKVTGRSYRTEIDQRIIRPLGLRDTRLPGSSPFITGPHSHGYEPVEKADGTLVPVDFTTVNMSVAGAAGEIISTTADLDRFFRTLLSGSLLRPAELREMTADTSGGWGLGLEIATLPCGTIVGHGGGTPGYRTVSFHTLDGTRQVTVDWTDWGTDADAGPAALALMTAALCPS